MGSDEGWAYLLQPGQDAEEVGPTSKAELAAVIIDRVASLLRSHPAAERG